eukprot:6185921-Pleurochrysis_carterae.AAC.3
MRAIISNSFGLGPDLASGRADMLAARRHLRTSVHMRANDDTPEESAGAPSSNQMLEALFASSEDDQPNDDDATAVPSHLRVARDEDGETKRVRFTYVDEHTCIGCTYCTQVARCTFALEPDNGRARDGDPADVIQEAIDSCPVSCIHYVSMEDLVVLEKEREKQVINNKARLVNQQESPSFAPPSAARGYGGMRCNNCPTKGCATCPMFGVGENPVYLELMRAREARRKASGELAEAEEAQRRAALLEAVTFGEELSEEETSSGSAEPVISAQGEAPADVLQGKLDALFGSGLADEDEDDGPRSE